jgi:3-methylcrotonyl-CoA carboxylase alpha subunit
LQRRHQKVIEEAPAPGMTDAVRVAMGNAAVRAAKAIGYAGAGTIEFIVDGSDGLREDGFWFMEMNTRLQVEHPVTEAITGVDLVEWQLRVASGEDLPMQQDELTISGHSFEARLYAEDAANDFLPATGRLSHLQFPDAARADTGVRSGDEVSPFYDPMIAKITVHGATRSIALSKLRQALSHTQVAGTVTNLGFLHALACHEGFAKGDVDTGLIARDQTALTMRPELSAESIANAVLCATDLEHPTSVMGFALWQPLVRQVHLRRGNDDILCKIEIISPSHVSVETPLGSVDAQRTTKGWMLNEKPGAPSICVDQHVYIFGPAGADFAIVDLLDRGSSAGGDTDVIVAPMPGLVKSIFVKNGQNVELDERLCVLEAMKMEHSLLSQRAGVVAQVLVSEGDQVEAGAALIRLEPEEETGP